MCGSFFSWNYTCCGQVHGSHILPIFRLSVFKFLCLFEQDHVEGYLELSAKTKTYFTTAFAMWDADFYVKVDDDVHVNIGEYKLS